MAVNTFQANTGYRDPLKAMTLKALEARAKSAAEATAQAMQPQTIAAPEQGWAQMIGALGANIQQGRVDSAAASGRDALAQAMARVNMDTGPSMEDIAIIQQHDPELAKSMYDQAMKTRQENFNREDTQTFTAGESLLERQQRETLEREKNALTQSESALQRGSSEKIATEGNLSSEKISTADNISQAAISSADNISQAAISAADNTASATRTQAEIDARAEQDRLKEANDPDSKVGQITHDFNQGVYNIPGEDQSHPNTIKRFQDAVAAEGLKDTPTQPGSAYIETNEKEASKRHQEILAAGTTSGEFKANITRMQKLGEAIGTGRFTPLIAEMGAWADAVGIDISGITASNEADAYRSLAEKMAPQMRAPGSGPSSDTDVKMFLNSLPSLSKMPGGNKIIADTFKALAFAKERAAQIVQEGAAQRLPWYEIDKQIAALGDPFKAWREVNPDAPQPPATTADPNAPAAPAAAAPAAPAAPDAGGGRTFNFDANGNPIP